MNRSVISKWMYGRLSIFDGDKKETLGMIKDSYLESAEDLKTRWEKQAIADQESNRIYLECAKVALKDLNGLIEAIILSDGLVNYIGNDLEYINSLAWNSTLGPSVWFKLIDPNKANNILLAIESSVPMKNGIQNDKSIIDALQFCDYMIRGGQFDWLAEVINEDGLDYQYMADKWVWLDDPMFYGNNITQSTKDKIESSLASILGPDWDRYEKRILQKKNWPDEMSYTKAYEFWMYNLEKKLSLYSEFKLALDSANFAVSSLTSGSYFGELSKLTSNLNIKEFITGKYHRKIQASYDDLGLGTVNLTIPPLLRMCMDDASSITQTIKNAGKLRRQKWAINLRKHITDLYENENMTGLQRKLSRLDVHLDQSLSAIRSGYASGISISAKASISLSLPTIQERILRWRNPAMVMYTKLSDALHQKDSLRDLEKIFKLTRLEVIDLIQNSDKQ